MGWPRRGRHDAQIWVKDQIILSSWCSQERICPFAWGLRATIFYIIFKLKKIGCYLSKRPFLENVFV